MQKLIHAVCSTPIQVTKWADRKYSRIRKKFMLKRFSNLLQVSDENKIIEAIDEDYYQWGLSFVF